VLIVIGGASDSILTQHPADQLLELLDARLQGAVFIHQRLDAGQRNARGVQRRDALCNRFFMRILADS